MRLQFGGSVAEATIDIRNQFVRKVYSILSVQLIATAIVSAIGFFSDSYKFWVQSHPGVVWVSVRLFPRPSPFLIVSLDPRDLDYLLTAL